MKENKHTRKKRVERSYLQILRNSNLVFCLIFAVYSLITSGYYWGVNLVNGTLAIVLAGIFYYFSSCTKVNHIYVHLRGSLFFYAFFAVSLCGMICFLYEGNSMMFSHGSDAYNYLYYASKMADMGWVERLNYIADRYKYDDWGAFYFMSIVFTFINDKLALNFVYILLIVATGLKIYKTGIFMMSKKYAFLCALTYSLSSYSIFFGASCLKECVFIYLVVSAYYSYYRFSFEHRLFHLYVMLAWLICILFFRPIVVAFIGIGAITPYIFEAKHNGKIRLGIFVLIPIFIYLLYNDLSSSVAGYTLGGNIDEVVDSREAYNNNASLTYAASYAGALIGPFPTFRADKNVLTCFYGYGLLFRLLLNPFFWMALVFSVIKKVKTVSPLLVSAVLEMISLASIQQGLELRKGLPHLVMVYWVAFWFLEKMDRKLVSTRFNKVGSYVVTIWTYATFFISLLWNIR